MGIESIRNQLIFCHILLYQLRVTKNNKPVAISILSDLIETSRCYFRLIKTWLLEIWLIPSPG